MGIGEIVNVLHKDARFNGVGNEIAWFTPTIEENRGEERTVTKSFKCCVR